MRGKAKSRAKHARKIELHTEAHAPILVRWYVVECKCGWSSPLCVSRDAADELYEGHRRRAKPKPHPVVVDVPQAWSS